MPLEGEYAPSTLDWARKQAELIEATDGAQGTDIKGAPVVVLTTVGAKTGALRKTALIRVEHDGKYAVVASLGGSPNEPKWAGNMRKQPHVELRDGAENHDYTAREVAGDEYDQWWERAAAVWPDYIEYQKKTDRVIAIFELDRRD